jgi:uncharacterized protein (DUF1810 family)
MLKNLRKAAVNINVENHMGLFRKDKEVIYGQQGLERFVEAQKRDYNIALKEVQNGKKETHWIWYIFPQMLGLGRSCYANLYGIKNKEEAEEYLKHKVLGKRLREVTNALLEHEGKPADDIFGYPDTMKVNSSMTLFDIICPDDIFAQVLDKFYEGKRCKLTLEMLEK